MLADGYYLNRYACILIVILTTNQPVTWHFTHTESTSTWFTCFNQVGDTPLAIVLDGKAGSIKAARNRWPRIVIQRCQFHVIQRINTLLTKHPESQASKELKSLVGKIPIVRSTEEWKSWVGEFKRWYLLYGDYLKEKTYHDSFTPTGRQKWHYTHGRLHTAFSHLKKAFPNLFQYLHHPEIPNTSNRIEGSINAALQRWIDAHRGLTHTGQKQLISAFLKSKQRL